MSPSFSTTVASTPVSSRTSRSAASAGDSPASGWPFGRARTLLPSAARRVGTITMQRPSRTTTPPAENSDAFDGISVDVAAERVRVVDGDPAAALRDDARALEDGEEAARRLARGARELGDVGLRDPHEDVARAGALRPRLVDELSEDDRDAALHGLERLAAQALVGVAEPPTERDHQLDRDIGVLPQETAHVRARHRDRLDRVERLDGRRSPLVVEHGE